jgi:hypothetical protein
LAAAGWLSFTGSATRGDDDADTIEELLDDAVVVAVTSVDHAFHSRESGLTEGCQLRLTVSVTGQHAKGDKFEQQWTKNHRSRAAAIPDGAEQSLFLWL